jgi:hypothetical protein
MKNKSAICVNCMHAGHQFKINNLTHLHCNKPEYARLGVLGEISPWDTLMKFGDTCKDFKAKES